MSKLLVAFAASVFVAAFWAVLLRCVGLTILVMPVAALSGFVTFITVAVVMGGDTRDGEAD